MTTQDKVKVIAEYDGWELDNELTTNGDLWYKKHYSITHFSKSINDLKYLTSLDCLHPVALNVLNHLVSEFNISTKLNTYVCASDHIGTIKKSMYKPPISGEYIDLFNAVIDGIIFLKSNK